MGFPDGLMVQNLSAKVGDTGSIPGLGRFPEGGNGYQLQYFCLENSLDREAWQSVVYGVAESRTLLSDFHYEFKVTPVRMVVCFSPTYSAPWGIWFRVSQKAVIKMLAKGYLYASRSH